MGAALRYLRHRPRSEAELRNQLDQRGFDCQHVEQVLSQLREKGLTNDPTFARLWVESRESSGPRSRAMLQRELREKGIDVQTISEAIESVDEESGAYRLAQKKAKAIAILDYASFRNKLFGVLRRRGFSYEICERTVNQIWQEQGKGELHAQES